MWQRTQTSSAFSAELAIPDNLECSQLSTAALRDMAAAAHEIELLQEDLAGHGKTILSDLLRGSAGFYEWQHYPPQAAFGAGTPALYYYHAHAASERKAGEHGHFHTFLRGSGIPPDIRPRPRIHPSPLGLTTDSASRLLHLVGIAVDNLGRPLTLFTVNRWVTGENWYGARDVERMIPRFAEMSAALEGHVPRWLAALLHLFRPQLALLLHKRDAVVAGWERRQPWADPLEDRRLHVTSWMEIRVERQIGDLRRLAHQAGASSLQGGRGKAI